MEENSKFPPSRETLNRVMSLYWQWDMLKKMNHEDAEGISWQDYVIKKWK